MDSKAKFSRKVAVIGAGPAGLTAIKQLVDWGHDVTCFEQQPAIGGHWAYYRNTDDTLQHFPNDGTWFSAAHSALRTNSSRFPNGYSHLEPSYPSNGQSMFFKRDEFLNYFKQYAKKTDLNKHIQLNSLVTKVDKVNDTWQVYVECEGNTKKHSFDRVLITTGYFGYPKIPYFTGLDLYQKPHGHSAQVRNFSNFKDKTIHVIGAMFSGSDVVDNAFRHGAKKIYWSMSKTAVDPKSTFLWSLENDEYGNVNPNYAFDQYAETRMSLTRPGLTKYLPWIRVLDEMPIGEQFGTNTKYEPDYDRVGICYRKESYTKWVDEGRLVPVAPCFRFNETEVTLTDGTKLDVDYVIYATGYAPKLPFLEHIWKYNDSEGLYHYVLPQGMKQLEGIAFTGFTSTLSSLFPLFEMQSRFIAQLWSCYPTDQPKELVPVFQEWVKNRKRKLAPGQNFAFETNLCLELDGIAKTIGVMPNIRGYLFDIISYTNRKMAIAMLFSFPFSVTYRLEGTHQLPKNEVKEFLYRHASEVYGNYFLDLLTVIWSIVLISPVVLTGYALTSGFEHIRHGLSVTSDWCSHFLPEWFSTFSN